MLNKPTGEMLNAAGNSTPANLGTASAGTSVAYSREDHVHAMPTAAQVGAISTDQQSGFATLTAGTLTTSQVPALTGDVTSTAGSPATTVVKLQGKNVSSATPQNGQVLQWTGADWSPGAIPNGGSGGGGVTYYLGAGTAAGTPTTGLPGTPKQLSRTAEVGQTTITSGTLSQTQYNLIAAFVTDAGDPNTTALPAGLFDFNLWAASNANSANQTVLQFWVYKYNGSTAPTLLSVSDDVSIYDPSVTAQYILSVTIPQTTILATDRLYVEVRGKATANNRTVTLKFGDSTPSHMHSTVPSVTGSGLVRVLNSVFQSPASPLVDADVSASAAIAQSKISGLTTSLAGKASTSTTISAGTGLTGGGDLSANRSLGVAYGTTAGTAAQGNDSRLSDSRTPSGSASGDLTGSYPAPTLAAITTAQNTAGSATQIPVISIDAKGRVTALTTTQATVYATTTQLAGYVATSQLGALNGVAQLDGSGKLVTGQIPALTTSQIAQITPPGIGAVATSQLTTAATANGVPQLDASGFLSTAQLATLAGLPTGAQGSSTVVPVVTVDSKGRVTALTTAPISGGGGGIQLVTVRATSNLQLATAGTITGGVWTNGSAVITFTSTTATLVRGMSISTGIVSGVIKSVDSATQITMTANAGASGSGAIVVYNSTTTTLATSNTTAIDGKTLAINDVVFLSQTALAQNGPWIVSALGTGVTLTRPTWFVGNLLAPMTFSVTAGTFLIGGIVSISLNSASITQEIGIESLAIAIVAQRGNSNAVLGTNQFATGSTQTFAAGTTASAPIKFQAGVVQTTPVAHAVEWDGAQMYLTNALAQRRRLAYIDDTWTVVASPGATGTINFDTETQDVLYYQTNAQANWVINVRGSSTISLSSLMAVGQSRTIVFMNTNGTTAYAPTVQVDGASQTVKWANGTSTGNASSTDMISLSIIKTAATPTYSVFGSITKFA